MLNYVEKQYKGIESSTKLIEDMASMGSKYLPVVKPEIPRDLEDDHVVVLFIENQSLREALKSGKCREQLRELGLNVTELSSRLKLEGGN